GRWSMGWSWRSWGVLQDAMIGLGGGPRLGLIGEGAAGTGEPSRWWGSPSAGQLAGPLGDRSVLQRLAEDPLEAAHVEQVDGERPGTGGVEAFRGEALPQAQHARRLAQGSPRPATGRDQPLDEGADVGPERDRLGVEPLGRA